MENWIRMKQSKKIDLIQDRVVWVKKRIYLYFQEVINVLLASWESHFLDTWALLVFEGGAGGSCWLLTLTPTSSICFFK